MEEEEPNQHIKEEIGEIQQEEHLLDENKDIEKEIPKSECVEVVEAPKPQ